MVNFTKFLDFGKDSKSLMSIPAAEHNLKKTSHRGHRDHGVSRRKKNIF